LKIGAPVVITSNLSRTLVNSTQAVVVDIKTDSVTIRTSNGNIANVQATLFAKYNIDSKQPVATRKQIPLRLSFAMTIHKCQG
ncbi:hypothetical protein LSAT2_024292, partial [Lamellibrachia satsuma]